MVILVRKRRRTGLAAAPRAHGAHVEGVVAAGHAVAVADVHHALVDEAGDERPATTDKTRGNPGTKLRGLSLVNSQGWAGFPCKFPREGVLDGDGVERLRQREEREDAVERLEHLVDVGGGGRDEAQDAAENREHLSHKQRPIRKGFASQGQGGRFRPRGGGPPRSNGVHDILCSAAGNPTTRVPNPGVLFWCFLFVCLDSGTKGETDSCKQVSTMPNGSRLSTTVMTCPRVCEENRYERQYVKPVTAPTESHRLLVLGSWVGVRRPLRHSLSPTRVLHGFVG